MKRFIVTFGQQHTHRVNNVTFDKDCVAVIIADNHEQAREMMFELFGGKFGTSYDEDTFDEQNLIKYFPRGKMEAN